MPCDIARATLVLLACAIGSPALGQVPTDMGGVNCAAYVATTLSGDAEKRGAIEHWIVGFAAGHRIARPVRSMSPIESAALVKQVERRCSNQPLIGVAEATLIELNRVAR
jgi:hypothetical protein